jgi:para-nitrobenzyl esterase
MNERRKLLKQAAALAGGLGSAAAFAGGGAGRKGAHAEKRDVIGDSVVARDGSPIVDTNVGKVVGYIRNGISTFKGIPYGDTTEGVNRFMPPAKAKPWSGVRSSRQYGRVAPQGPRAGWANDEEAFMFAWDDGIQGEDCLRVNVWTPGIGDGVKRPVMVWLHGGGFAAGSGQELRSYDGENLSRRGDLVVVSLNHRLNVFGHLDLAQFGDDFSRSANVGMLDIVAALQWVRDNIAGFGGDPKSVTVFGQSGGGGKVSMLMGMPAAKGLFQRAIVQSGSMLRAGTQENSQQLAAAIVSELGLSRSNIRQIQQLPFGVVLQAGLKVMRERNPPRAGSVPNFRRMAEMLGFAPVLDGAVIPAHPFDPSASELSADVPMIIGSTLNEFVTAINHPEYEALSESELEQRVRSIYEGRTQRILAAFRQRTPNASAFDLWSRIAASSVRQSAIAQATVKAALGKAPAYLYWFTWQTPILSGRPRAFHCAEIPFVLANTDRCETMTGGGDDARALGAIMSDAWIQFARTGNPSHAGLRDWQAFSARENQTMIFDNRSSLVNGPDRAEQQSIVDG